MSSPQAPAQQQRSKAFVLDGNFFTIKKLLNTLKVPLLLTYCVHNTLVLYFCIFLGVLWLIGSNVQYAQQHFMLEQYKMQLYYFFSINSFTWSIFIKSIVVQCTLYHCTNVPTWRRVMLYWCHVIIEKVGNAFGRHECPLRKKENNYMFFYIFSLNCVRLGQRDRRTK